MLDLIEQHRSTIVFANSRRLSERLCARLNELAAERAQEAAAAELEESALENPESLAAGPRHAPAELMAQSGTGSGAPAEIARAHHGSVSRQERTEIEEALKRGTLSAVVATSSLELGIDMGAVDLVIQVEAPPSVASGLQRIGRAGHNVGDVSRGVIFPKYQGDLVQATVVAERMHGGNIEELRAPRNPLDVLAQQIVAMTSMDEWSVDELEQVVRRAAPFAGLTRPVLDATLDMLAGRYPSEEFAGLRPRVVWDRLTGVVRGRPGGQRLAVTSGGTIPDRGLFGVFLAGSETGSGSSRRHSRRVGELDEEMVYESRVGDVFVLGASSWRIEDITADSVLVTPAPGQPGKLPFWHGDALGRPAELGAAIGAKCRELAGASEQDATQQLTDAGLDELAAGNLVALPGRSARGHRVRAGRPDAGGGAVPGRARRLAGGAAQPVRGAGARAVGVGHRGPAAGTLRRHGRAGHAHRRRHHRAGAGRGRAAADRGGPDRPGRDQRDRHRRDRLLGPVRVQVPGVRGPGACCCRGGSPGGGHRCGSSGSGPRSCSRWPATTPRSRSCSRPCASACRTCSTCRRWSACCGTCPAGKIRIVEVETQTPSPFSRSLLFRYVGAFMYEGDAPLAERRAQALTLDSALLADLLGQADLRELLDPAVVSETEQELQRVAEDRKARDLEGLADVLRTAGPLSADEVAERCTDPAAAPAWLAELAHSRRAIEVRVGGQPRWAAIEDASRLRDALGVPLPPGMPEAFTEPLPDPLGDLVSRYARTHGPFTADAAASRYALGVAVVAGTLRRLAAAGRVVEGEFLPGGRGTEWCDTEVLRMLRRRCLARLRKEAEPAPPVALARLLPAWQGVRAIEPAGRGPGNRRRSRGPSGPGAVLDVLDQLAGAPVAASALETLVLPGRIPDYSPTMLDELTAAGEVVWTGAGGLPGGDGWLVLASAESAPLLFPAPAEITMTPIHEAVLDALADGGAVFFRMLHERVSARLAGEPGLPKAPADNDVATAIWDLTWAGLLTNDTLGPLRTVLGSGGPRRTGPSASTMRSRSPRHGRRSYGRPAMPSRTGPPNVSGRWSLLPPGATDATLKAHALAQSLLDRYGILTKGAVAAERIPGGFSTVYPVLRAMEDAGRTRRGYFVEGLGAAQFAIPGAVDRMRSLAQPPSAPPDPLATALSGGPVRYRGQASGGDGAFTDLWEYERDGDAVPVTGPEPADDPADRQPGQVIVLAAADPANAYGASLPWPERPDETPGGHRPGRKAGALVILADGELVLYVERGGRTLLSWTDDLDQLRPVCAALADAVRAGALGRLTVERADGDGIYDSPLATALEEAGFRPTPRGLRLRG